MFRNSFKRLAIFSLVLLATAFGLSVKAQTSSVDLSFNAIPEKNSTARPGFILQPDGKIIVYGSFRVVNGAVKNQIVRLNPDGSFDNTFDCATCDITIYSAILQPDGKLLISGTPPNGLSQAVVYRLNPDGSRDPNFVSPFAPNQYASNAAALQAIQPDGKILVDLISGGYGGGLRYHTIYRLNPNGSLDNTFTTISFQGYLNSAEYPVKVVVQPDGKIFIAGNYLSGFGSSGFLRRFNADGTRDTTYESPSFANSSQPYNLGTIYDFDFLADGSVIVVGSFTTVNAVNRLNIAKLQPAGNVDLSFNPANVFNVSGAGTGIKVLPDGKVLISTSDKIYRFNADGSLDNSFVSPSSLTQIYSWKLDSSGKIFVYGAFLENGVSVDKFARLNQNGALESSFNIGFGTNSSITALAAQPDGKVVFAGDFARVGGVSRISIARVNADGSLDSSFNAGTGYDGEITKILVQTDGKILVVGSFYNFNGTARANFARLNADGSLDTNFNFNLTSGTVYTAALQADGKIIIGGAISSVNGTTRTGVARINADGSLDATFNPIFGTATIRSLTVQADGKILVGGFFNAVNGFSRSNLVRLNADGTLDSAFSASSVSAVTQATVNQIEVLPDGRVFILANSLVRLNNNGTLDSSFASPSTNGTILQLSAQPDGSVIIGGGFTQVNSGTRANLARLQPNGLLDSGFFPTGTNGTVRAISRQADGKIFIGGDFTIVGGVIRLGIARLNIAAYRLVTPFDFDGDGKAEISVFRPSNGVWYWINSASNVWSGVQFGALSDRLAPADYDGDGKTDLAVFRDNVPGAGDKAYFYILNSADNTFRPVQFGTQNDLPMSGDWDGDGKADLAVYRAGTGTSGQSYFFYRPSSQSGVDFRAIAWGGASDKPLAGDFDGDGKQDAAVFNPSLARWIILRSSNGTVINTNFGTAGDIPTPADYDGDGTTNIAVFRPSTGYWYTSTNAQTNYGAVQFGASGDLPVPADYDGDGKADVAVFRPSNGGWYLNRSTSGFTGVAFGISEDRPIPNAFIR